MNEHTVTQVQNNARDSCAHALPTVAHINDNCRNADGKHEDPEGPPTEHDPSKGQGHRLGQVIFPSESPLTHQHFETRNLEINQPKHLI